MQPVSIQRRTGCTCAPNTGTNSVLVGFFKISILRNFWKGALQVVWICVPTLGWQRTELAPYCSILLCMLSVLEYVTCAGLLWLFLDISSVLKKTDRVHLYASWTYKLRNFDKMPRRKGSEPAVQELIARGFLQNSYGPFSMKQRSIHVYFKDGKLRAYQQMMFS